MSKHYPISDSCTSITIGGIVYNTVLTSDDYECENCDLREVCEDSEDDALSLFCAVHIDGNHHFETIK